MRKFLNKSRNLFLFVGLFSFASNILQLAIPIYFMQVFDRVMTSHSEETLLVLTLGIGVVLVALSIFEGVRARILAFVGQSMDQMIGTSVVNATLAIASRQPFRFTYRTGLRDVGTLRQFLSGNPVIAFFDAPWAPINIGIIALFDIRLGVLATAGIALLFLLAVIEDRLTRPWVERSQETAQEAGRLVGAALRNAELVGTQGMIAPMVKRWRERSDESMTQQMHAHRRSVVTNALAKSVRYGLQVLMMALGVYLVIRQEATPGVILASTLILSRAMAPMEQVIGSWKMFVEARGAYKRLNEYLTQIGEPLEPMPLPEPAGNLSIEKLSLAGQEGAVILKNIHFDIHAGEALAIIGPSGAGKTSLSRLLVGAWQPSAGCVRLDGADLAKCDPAWAGRHLGYLPQHVELLPGSIGENIARMDDAQARADDIVLAARKAGAHDMILRLPKGYDTLVGEGGLTLSGGQTQRVGLARALFGKPSLVVLDEPNASLDTEGEAALLGAIRTLKTEGATLVVVSHRPSLLGDMDRILVLKEGSIQLLGPRQDVFARLAVAPQSGAEGAR